MPAQPEADASIDMDWRKDESTQPHKVGDDFEEGAEEPTPGVGVQSAGSTIHIFFPMVCSQALAVEALLNEKPIDRSQTSKAFFALYACGEVVF